MLGELVRVSEMRDRRVVRITHPQWQLRTTRSQIFSWPPTVLIADATSVVSLTRITDRETG